MASRLLAPRWYSPRVRRYPPALASVVIACLVSSNQGFVPRKIFLGNGFCSSVRKFPALLATVVDQEGSLELAITESFAAKETDGILELACLPSMRDLPVDNIVAAILKISEDLTRGQAASILNAFVGSCCLMDDRKLGAARALDFLDHFDDLDAQIGMAPDLVTLCLAFTAINRDHDRKNVAEEILGRAVRRSKKLAGNRRRKSLVACKRKREMSFSEAEEEIQNRFFSSFEVLFESEDLVAVNKPTSVTCYHERRTTAGKVRRKKADPNAKKVDISLEDAFLTFNLPLSTLNEACLGLVHRLDRAASGCLILAKTERAHAMLVSSFFLRKVKKVYQTIVSPCPDPTVPLEGLIELPVNGRPAITDYRILDVFPVSNAALLEIHIRTGRKNQIRSHCANGLSSPILLDDLFPCDAERLDIDSPSVVVPEDANSKNFIFLHSSEIAIAEFEVDCKSQLPWWWTETVNNLKNQNQ